MLTEALKQTQRVWSRFAELHEERGLPPLPAPHWGLVNAIHGWAQGKSLDAVISKTDVAPGDMVRWCKQVIDALDQIAKSAPTSTTTDRANAAIAAMRRGVVAY